MKFPVSGSATLTYNSTISIVEVTNAKRVMGGVTLAAGRVLFLRQFGLYSFCSTDGACVHLCDAANGNTECHSPSAGTIRAAIICPTMGVTDAGQGKIVEFKPPGLKFSTECVMALSSVTGTAHSDTCTGIGAAWGLGYYE